MGKRGGKRVSTSVFRSSEASSSLSHPRVEAGPEAVVAEVVNDQFAQIFQKYPKQMYSTRNTTMDWAWLKSLKEKSFGQHCEENSQIAFASLVQKGTEHPTNTIGHMLIT